MCYVAHGRRAHGCILVRSGETLFGVGLVGGPGGRQSPPPGAGEFSKIFKNFLKKIAKNALF